MPEAIEQKIPKRLLSSLMNSLSAGVVPRMGAQYIAIGRNDEINAILEDLENIDADGSSMRFIIGKYGSGKSFLIQLTRSYALERGFLTADCDLSPERRICGTNGSGIATYRELIKNLSSSSSPDGGALPQIVAKWLSNIQGQTASEGYEVGSEQFIREVSKKIFALTTELESYVGGFDFASVINTYYKAYTENNEILKSSCLRWLRGEFQTKTEAKRSLPVGDIIDDDNWFDYLKLMAVFAKKTGYRGLMVFLDECVNLYKIPNRISRENNYEKLLSMFNDTLGGKSPGLGFILGGTPQFLEDTRRGLYSYDALRSRLYDGRFSDTEFKNLSGPIIRLRRLSNDEMFALILRVTKLYELYYSTSAGITNDDIKKFLSFCLEKVGADTMITPREILRDYLSMLNILRQNKDATVDKLLGEVVTLEKAADAESDDQYSDFNIDDIEI